jgi:hypothetical protein
MNSNELRAAAKELLRIRVEPDCKHTWNAHRQCQWCHSMKRDIDSDLLAHYILSTVHADDDEPVEKIAISDDLINFAFTNGKIGFYFPRIKTRGQFRKLLEALGVDV